MQKTVLKKHKELRRILIGEANLLRLVEQGQFTTCTCLLFSKLSFQLVRLII